MALHRKREASRNREQDGWNAWRGSYLKFVSSARSKEKRKKRKRSRKINQKIALSSPRISTRRKILSSQESRNFFLSFLTLNIRTRQCPWRKFPRGRSLVRYTFRISNRFAVRWQWQTFLSTERFYRVDGVCGRVCNACARCKVWAIDRDMWERMGGKEATYEYYFD